MKNRERFVIYGLLAVLVAVQLPALTGAMSSTALARSLGIVPDLGPAERLTLIDADDEVADELVLRNAGGRLAWSDDATDAVHSMAFVHDRAIMDELLKSEDREEERAALREELASEAEEYREQLRELEESAQNLEPGSPDFEQAYQEWSRVGEAFSQWQQQARERGAELESGFLEEAYRELVAAVEIVAEREDIDLVLRFIPPSEEFDSADPRTTSLLIRMRTALRYPRSMDLTDLVLDELDVTIE